MGKFCAKDLLYFDCGSYRGHTRSLGCLYACAVKYGGDALDVSGYRSLMVVADCVRAYVESGRAETDELHLDVLDWALSGFEYKGIVFVLVHDQEFW